MAEVMVTLFTCNIQARCQCGQCRFVFGDKLLRCEASHECDDASALQ